MIEKLGKGAAKKRIVSKMGKSNKSSMFGKSNKMLEGLGDNLRGDLHKRKAENQLNQKQELSNQR